MPLFLFKSTRESALPDILKYHTAIHLVRLSIGANKEIPKMCYVGAGLLTAFSKYRFPHTQPPAVKMCCSVNGILNGTPTHVKSQ